MTQGDPLISELQEGRRRFMALVADVRPELHRYCARMTGSVADGEDVVQETLARAYYALSELEELPPLRPWLFRIAHHRALDYLGRYERRMGQPLDSVKDVTADAVPDAENLLAREEAVNAALSRFMELAPAQRSAVILKDVLGHSLEEIASLLELSVPAVKAALHRGRTRLKEAQPPPVTAKRQVSPEVARYVALFNARDWDGVRTLLAEDVELDLVNRAQRSGRRAVGAYFTNYDKVRDWQLVPAWLDGREVIAFFHDPSDAKPGYFIELTFEGAALRRIHDFRYVPYAMDDARIELLPG